MRRIGTLLLALCLLLCACGADNAKEAEYVQAQALFQEEKFDQAAEAFSALGTYKDSQYLLKEAELAREYAAAMALLEQKDYPGAYESLCKLGNYKDVPQRLERFQRILLTEENWDTYFEIYDELDRSEAEEADTGGYNGMKVHFMFRLKEEYEEKLYAPLKNNLTLSMNATYCLMAFVPDEETDTYEFLEDRDTMGYNKPMEVKGLEDGRRAMIASERVSRWLDDEGVFEKYLCHQWRDLEIKSLAGELYLYVE